MAPARLNRRFGCAAGPQRVLRRYQGGNTTSLDGPGGSNLTRVSRIFTVSVASVYPHYVAKVEKKGAHEG